MKVDEMLAKLFRPPRILLVGNGGDELRRTVQCDYECDVDEVNEIGCCAPKLRLDRYDLILIDLAQTSEIIRAVNLIRTIAPMTPVLVVANSALAPIVNALDTEIAFIKALGALNWEDLFKRLRIRAKVKAAPQARPAESSCQMTVAVG